MEFSTFLIFYYYEEKAERSEVVPCVQGSFDDVVEREFVQMKKGKREEDEAGKKRSVVKHRKWTPVALFFFPRYQRTLINPPICFFISSENNESTQMAFFCATTARMALA